MAELTLTRVVEGDLLQPEHLNQYADAIDEMRAKEHPSVMGLAALAATASVSARVVTRRSLLFPFAKKNAK